MVFLGLKNCLTRICCYLEDFFYCANHLGFFLSTRRKFQMGNWTNVDIIFFSKLKCNFYTWLQSQQLRLTRIRIRIIRNPD
jgi:hypothetical protein